MTFDDTVIKALLDNRNNEVFIRFFALVYGTCFLVTANFLKACHKVGIRRVAIGIKWNKVKSSVKWGNPLYNVFADEKDKNDIWPAIWAACTEANISWGCGNSGQHQIESTLNIIRGGFEYTENGWIRVVK